MFRYTPTNVDLNGQTSFQALMSSVFVDKQSFTESKGWIPLKILIVEGYKGMSGLEEHTLDLISFIFSIM